jgi:hypothetical protein
VFQLQLPIQLPCYDLAPVTDVALAAPLPKVKDTVSGTTNFRGLTGGVYKAQERIHRGMLIRDY